MPEDLFYRTVVFNGRGVLKLCSQSLVLHPERSALEGGFLLAANHLSPFDVSCLMGVTRRRIDFVSIVEMFEKPIVGWIFGHLNAMPLDRHRPDRVTIRQIVSRLRKGRAVAIFPEGSIRDASSSVLKGGTFREGFGQMAQMAGVPVVPCVVLGSRNFYGVFPWLPHRRTRFAVAFGEPILPETKHADGRPLGRSEARVRLEASWLQAVQELHGELESAIAQRPGFANVTV